MTDTTTDTEQTVNNPAPELADDGQSSAGQNDNDTITRQDLFAAVEKARQQEKDKLYSRLESLDSSREELNNRLEESSEMLRSLMQERDDANKQLQEKALEELSAEEKVALRLKALEEKEASLQAQLEQVATEAAKRVRDSELKLYRANRLAQEGLTLTELVSGSSEQEIDDSIKRAREREDIIFAKARESVKAEMSQNLPKPSAPAPVEQSASAAQLVDPRKKYELANLSPQDFNKLKAELLERARSNS